jgi:hypothetical protein
MFYILVRYIVLRNLIIFGWLIANYTMLLVDRYQYIKTARSNHLILRKLVRERFPTVARIKQPQTENGPIFEVHDSAFSIVCEQFFLDSLACDCFHWNLRVATFFDEPSPD